MPLSPPPLPIHRDAPLTMAHRSLPWFASLAVADASMYFKNKVCAREKNHFVIIRTHINYIVVFLPSQWGFSFILRTCIPSAVRDTLLFSIALQLSGTFKTFLRNITSHEESKWRTRGHWKVPRDSKRHANGSAPAALLLLLTLIVQIAEELHFETWLNNSSSSFSWLLPDKPSVH